MIKAVIFDMDGLILDTEKLLVKYWCQAANEAGFPMQREHALNIRSLSFALKRRLMRRAGMATWVKTFSAAALAAICA